jgi:prepilin peptidase CpaA
MRTKAACGVPRWGRTQLPVWVFPVLKLTIELTYAACCLLCAVAGAVFDITSRRVPNFVTLPAICLGLLLHLIFGSWPQLAAAAAAGLLCGSIFLLFYLAGGMGAGDVKLIAAAGCISGLSLIGPLLVFTSLAGGVMAFGLALYHRRLKETVLNIGALAVHHRMEGLVPHPILNVSDPRTVRLPYAVAIATGSALSLLLLFVRR